MARIPTLERLLGRRLSDIGEADLRRLVDEGVPESDHLDYKGELPPPDELAKDLCAFANGGGGALVIGIGEDGQGRPSLLTAVERPAGELGLKFRGMLTSRVRPTPAFDVRWIESADVGGRGYLLFAVPSSRDAPHALGTFDRRDDHTMRFPIRRGTGTEYLTESELAQRYARRFRDASDRHERAAALVAAITDHYLEDGSAQLTVAVVPVSPGYAQIGDELVQMLRGLPLPNALASRSFGIDPQLRVSATRFVQGGVQLDVPDAAITVYADGSVCAHSQIPTMPVAGYERHPRQPAVVEVNWLAVRLAGLLAFACDAASGCAGCGGEAVVSVRLDAVTAHQTSRPLALVGQPSHSNLVIFLCGDHTIRGSIRSTVYISIDAIAGGPVTAAVREFHSALADITQALGVASPPGITEAGTVAPAAWNYRGHAATVRAWAESHDVDIET